MAKKDYIEGEIMPATLQEVQFARRVNKGEDPVDVVRKVTRVGKRAHPDDRGAMVQSKALQLLRSCQEKMLIDISGMAPKGLRKLEELMEAQEPVYWMGRKVGQKNSLAVQFRAAKTIVDLAKPSSDEKGPSLVGLVLNINSD